MKYFETFRFSTVRYFRASYFGSPDADFAMGAVIPVFTVTVRILDLEKKKQLSANIWIPFQRLWVSYKSIKCA